MADYWVLHADSDNCLLFRAKNGDDSKIISLEPAAGADSKGVKVTTGEYGSELVAYNVEIDNCVTVQTALQVLPEQPDATSFCRVLEGIMRGHGFTFNIRGIPAPLTSTPVTATKGKRRKVTPAISGFQNQVEVIRNLHPELSKVGDNIMLNPRIKTWRKQAAAALGIPENDHGMFGGWYKEAIAVSCFSKRCYKEARQIMQELEATRQKVNGFLFEQCCGIKDEMALYQLLRRMAQGEMSKEDFRKAGKETKVALEELDDPDSTWKKKAQALEKENRELKAEIEKLKNAQGSKLPVPQRKTAMPQVVLMEEEADEREDEFTFNEVEENDEETTMVTIQPPRKRQKRTATYKVNYKPASDTSEVLDDSDGDPHWAEKTEEETTTDSDEENVLNTAFTDDSKQVPEIIENPLYTSPLISPEKALPSESEMSWTAVPVAGLRGVYEIDQDIVGDSMKIPLPSVSRSKEKEVLTRDVTRPATDRRTGRARSQRNETFHVGEHVMAFFKNGGKTNWTEWSPGVISGILMNGEQYTVAFDDGANRCVRRSEVKKKEDS